MGGITQYRYHMHMKSPSWSCIKRRLESVINGKHMRECQKYGYFRRAVY